MEREDLILAGQGEISEQSVLMTVSLRLMHCPEVKDRFFFPPRPDILFAGKTELTTTLFFFGKLFANIENTVYICSMTIILKESALQDLNINCLTLLHYESICNVRNRKGRMD